MRSLGVPNIGSSQSLIRELVTELSELDIEAENTAASTRPRRPVLVKFTTNVISACRLVSIGIGGGECEKKQAIATPIVRKKANCKNTIKPLIPRPSRRTIGCGRIDIAAPSFGRRRAWRGRETRRRCSRTRAVMFDFVKDGSKSNNRNRPVTCQTAQISCHPPGICCNSTTKTATAPSHVNGELQAVVPDHRSHAAEAGIHGCHRADDQHARQIIHAECRVQHHCGQHQAQAVGQISHDQKHERCQPPGCHAEAPLQHLVRGEHLAAKIGGQHQRDDSQPAQDVADTRSAET